jgi:hypothetical protein
MERIVDTYILLIFLKSVKTLLVGRNGRPRRNSLGFHRRSLIFMSEQRMALGLCPQLKIMLRSLVYHLESVRPRILIGFIKITLDF